MAIIGTATSAFYDRSKTHLTDLRKQAESLQQQLGREKLARSSDAPVAASRLRALMRADRMATIDTANADRARNDLARTDDALQDFAGSIIRARELAGMAATGTLKPQQRAAIGVELEQIHAALVSLANARNSTGQALFGGETTGDAYVLDAAGNAAYVGTASAGTLDLGEGQSVARGLTGPEFLDFTVKGTPTNLLALVKELGQAMQGGVADPQAVAGEALDSLGAALDSITTNETVIGTRLAWIDLTLERHTDVALSRAEEQAEIGGTDLGETIAELQQTMLVLEASQASFARLARLSLFDQLR